jgi:hypothetical protein
MSGEHSPELPFESTEGEISDIEDQVEVPSDSSKPLTLPVVSVTSPTVGLSRPPVVLSSPTALFQTSIEDQEEVSSESYKSFSRFIKTCRPAVVLPSQPVFPFSSE